MAGAAAGAGLTIAGGLMGQSAAREQMSAADKARADALALFSGIKPPDIEQMKLQYEMPSYAGDYSAILDAALQKGPSAMEEVAVDPRLKAAQMAALSQVSEIASQGGLNSGDLAAIELTRRQAQAQDQARQQAILQEMQQRGQAGSGAELIARLKSAQSAADRASVEGLETNKMAQARALQALAQQASLGSQIRGQEYGEQTDLARARDAIADFNIQNQQNVRTRNVGLQSEAAQRNLTERQRQLDMATQLRNQQQEKNKGLAQQQFSNQLALATGQAPIYNQAASNAMTAAGQQATMFSGIGSGLGQIAAGAFAPKTTPTTPSTYSGFSLTPNSAGSSYSSKADSTG